MDNDSEPKVLIPYPGPDASGNVQDIFVYLRPETNGVLVESTLLKVVKECRAAGVEISLIYLANIPGEFILGHHIVERHYAQKFYFAVHGKNAFTPAMKARVESFFDVVWNETNIVGAFEALNLLHKTPEELHSTWVPAGDLLVVDGQSVKRIGDLLVVNYDIPALLAKNNNTTDVAVMLFRCNKGADFDDVVSRMHDALVDQEVIGPDVPTGRAFHYSKGPFEQVLDAVDYLYQSGPQPVPLEQLSFVRFAADHGHSLDELMSVVKNPICLIEDESGEMKEENIFTLSADDSYTGAVDRLSRLRGQVWTRR